MRRHGGKPLTGPALERFLPWNASPDDLHTPGAATATVRRINPRTGNARTGIGHHERPYRLPACSLTRLSNTYPNPSSLAMSIR
jgi:hypothetical protein